MTEEDKQLEIWKPIPNYEEYEVSTFGRVKRLAYDKPICGGSFQHCNERILSPQSSEIEMNMFFRRDYKHFLMQRDAVDDCIIYIRLYHFGIIPYWYRFMDTYSHFSECLEIIKEWCCDNNIGRAIIHDPAGANPLMTIKYRQYKSEVLNELKQ